MLFQTLFVLVQRLRNVTPAFKSPRHTTNLYREWRIHKIMHALHAANTTSHFTAHHQNTTRHYTEVYEAAYTTTTSALTTDSAVQKRVQMDGADYRRANPWVLCAITTSNAALEVAVKGNVHTQIATVQQMAERPLIIDKLYILYYAGRSNDVCNVLSGEINVDEYEVNIKITCKNNTDCCSKTCEAGNCVAPCIDDGRKDRNPVSKAVLAEQ
ncbi:hypothetical protein J6590_101375 [Homalodisca vitripennis]|nr:hypothetical protein J6590_101375 [Homalodisca vitripennis]